MLSSTLLQEAIAAIKNGRYTEARRQLYHLLEQDPHHELAWLWLSEASDDLTERIFALEKAFSLNPSRAATQKQLAKLKAAVSDHPPQTAAAVAAPLAAAIEAAGSGRFREARTLLIKLTDRNPEHEAAWLLLSTLVDTIEDKIIALENAHTLNPDNAHTQQLLAARQRGQVDDLTIARAYEKKGELPQAIRTYEALLTHTTIPGERQIAQKRLVIVHQQHNPIKATSPTFTLLRLMAGPPILYALLIFIHSGLNPTHIPATSCLGGFFVIAGSFLLNAPTYATPLLQRSPIFRSQKTLLYTLTAVMGLLILFFPFLIFIMGAVNRLIAFRANIP